VRVQLNLSNGSLSGHRFTIRDHQRVSIGSTQWAEICLNDDEVSDVQCSIRSDGQSCLLTNLEPTVPVYVNGVSVAKRSLVNGDIISVGRTVLSVSVEVDDENRFSDMGIRLAGQDATGRQTDPAGRTTATGSLPSPQPIKVNGREPGALTQFSSGVTCHRGTSSVACPVEVARQLDQQYRMHLLADISALETVVRDHGHAIPILCDLFSDAPALAVVSPDLECDRFAMLTRLWGNGLATAVFSNDGFESLNPALEQCLPWLMRSPASQLDSLQQGSYPEILLTVDAVLVDHSKSEEWLLLTAPGVEWPREEDRLTGSLSDLSAANDWPLGED